MKKMLRVLDVAVLEGAERTLPKNVRGNEQAEDARIQRGGNPKVLYIATSYRYLAFLPSVRVLIVSEV